MKNFTTPDAGEKSLGTTVPNIRSVGDATKEAYIHTPRLSIISFQSGRQKAGRGAGTKVIFSPCALPATIGNPLRTKGSTN